MNLNFNRILATQYKSQPQAIRVMTEAWVKNEIFCPNCGNFINDFKNNSPVADFYCASCKEEYELKSKKDEMGKKIVDGAYTKMIERLKSSNNPSFFFLNYNPHNYEVHNFVVIPKHFFIPEIIEKRRPLSARARRSGWIGCNILLQSMPESGKIYYVRDKKIETREKILASWRKTLFLREADKPELKGWILDVMKCIDHLNKKEFLLEDVYNFERILEKKHPENRHVKDKIRQQLQFLRDFGYLEFLERGKYKVT